MNSTIPFFTDTTFMVHISRDSCICERSLIKHSNKLASCQINTKKILTPTDLNKNWSVKTLIHSEFHACMKQSKLKIFINFLAGSNSEAIQHRMLAEEFLNGDRKPTSF